MQVEIVREILKIYLPFSAQFGSVIFNNGKWDTINWTSFHLSEFSQDNALRESILLKFRGFYNNLV